jgi:hypothetical protein
MPFGPFGIWIADAAEHLGSILARNVGKGGPLHPDKTATPELFKSARTGEQPALNSLEKLGYRKVWRNKKNWDAVEREALTFQS